MVFNFPVANGRFAILTLVVTIIVFISLLSRTIFQGFYWPFPGGRFGDPNFSCRWVGWR